MTSSLIGIILFITLQSGFSVLMATEWPDGTYGLPEPSTGCPTGWSPGFVYHNTEDIKNSNKRSNGSFHLSGVFNSRGIEQSFCIKNNSTGSVQEGVQDKKPPQLWPPGKYCIYKKGECPAGMSSGSVFWDDEKSQQDLPNSHDGSLPDGQYDLTTTLVFFCCSVNGSVEEPIVLPTQIPFYLFPYGNKSCQKSTIEFIYFDDNDEGNRDSSEGTVPFGIDPNKYFNILLMMCYYEANIFTTVVPQSPVNFNNSEVDKQLFQDSQSKDGKYASKNSLIIAVLLTALIGAVIGVSYGFYRYKSVIKERCRSLLGWGKNPVAANEPNSA